MAKMHSRKRGKSGSHRPKARTKPAWVRYGDKELIMLIQKLSKEGNTPSKIGLVLRDVYGIPDVRPILNKKISEVLREKKLLPELPEDLMALIKKASFIKKHFDANHQDKMSLRGLQLTESKINRLVKYYKRVGMLSADWKYNPERLKMYVE